MDLGQDELMQSDGAGFDKLIAAMILRVFPHAVAEAKELYQVGHKTRGPMARQSGEPMVSFISRRKRWWSKLKLLDPTIELSTTILGDLMLDCSNMGEVEKLMVLTSTGNDRSFDKIAVAMMEQHAKIHLKDRADKHSAPKDRHPPFKKVWMRGAHMADGYPDPDPADEDGDEGNEATGYWADGSWWEEDGDDEVPECETVEDAQLDVFTCLLCQGFPGDQELMAPFIQAESTAYYAGGKPNVKGKLKGKGKSKGKKGKRFSSGMKPSLSLDERKKALQALKAKTKCNECGEYGHRDPCTAPRIHC